MGALRDLAARLRALPLAPPEPKSAEPAGGVSAESPAPVARPAAPPPQGLNGWGLTGADKVAALAHLSPVSPAAAWWAMPYCSERGRAFADARREPGACPNCAARRWWCEAGEPDTALRCATCHPPVHLRAKAVRVVVT